MDLKIESKIGVLRSDCHRIYSFLSDCNNFQQFVTNNKVKDFYSDSDSCSFSIDGIGSLAFSIVERCPGELVKFTIENAQAENIFLWIQLKNAGLDVTRVKLTTKMDVNPMMKMLLSTPLKSGLDRIVDALEQVCK